MQRSTSADHHTKCRSYDSGPFHPCDIDDDKLHDVLQFAGGELSDEVLYPERAGTCPELQCAGLGAGGRAHVQWRRERCL
jgi:hypothetical protein